MIEPHDMRDDDSWKKAKGLAAYAEKHGDQFGRLLIGVIDNRTLRAIDANDRKTRERLKRLASNDELQNLLADG